MSLGFNERTPHVERAENSSNPAVEEGEEEKGVGNLGTSEQKRTAKIHDFCFGIPFGESFYLLPHLSFLARDVRIESQID